MLPILEQTLDIPSNPAMPFGQPQPQSWPQNKCLVKHRYATGDRAPHCSGQSVVFGLHSASGLASVWTRATPHLAWPGDTGPCWKQGWTAPFAKLSDLLFYSESHPEGLSSCPTALWVPSCSGSLDGQKAAWNPFPTVPPGPGVRRPLILRMSGLEGLISPVRWLSP